MEFLNVPLIAIVSPYLVGYTVENIQIQHAVIEGSPAVSEGKSQQLLHKLLIQSQLSFFVPT